MFLLESNTTNEAHFFLYLTPPLNLLLCVYVHNLFYNKQKKIYKRKKKRTQFLMYTLK